MLNLLSEQRKFYQTQATLEVAFRKRQLVKLRNVLLEERANIEEALYKDFKKSAFDTYTSEFGLVLRDIDHALRKIKQWSKVKRTKTNLLNFPASSYVVPEPLGNALIIGAWNYPVLLTLTPLVACLSAGNTAILKPSELAPNCSRILKSIFEKKFKSSYIAVVEGGVKETTELLEQKFDKIFFTGSAAVGKIVYKAAAEHLTPVTLELGGKSPAIISAHCNLKMAAKRLVWAKFLNAGQTCIAPDYIMVDQKIEGEFIDLLKSEIEKSEYSIENGNYVEIINQRHFDRIVDLIPVNKIAFGGKHSTDKRWIEPTLLKDVSFEDKVMKDEIFGPLLPIISYQNFDEALAKIQTLPKPLACYLFSNNPKERRTLLRKLSFGGGAMNDALMQITNEHMPFGGVGSSGIGAYHGENGFKTFSHFKSILDKPNFLELPLKYAPFRPWKFKWIKMMFKL